MKKYIFALLITLSMTILPFPGQAEVIINNGYILTAEGEKVKVVLPINEENISLPYKGTGPDKVVPPNPSKKPKKLTGKTAALVLPYDDETDKKLTLEQRAKLLAQWYAKYFDSHGQPLYDNLPSEEDVFSTNSIQGEKRWISVVTFATRFNGFKWWAEDYAKYFYPNGQRRSKLSLPTNFDKSPLDGYIQGKICDVEGEPIIGFSFLLKSLNGHFSTGKYHPPYSNEKGEYQINIPSTELPTQFELFEGGEGVAQSRIHRKVYVKKGETVHVDLMIEGEPRTRPWWHFKYNTGNCDKPWPF